MRSCQLIAHSIKLRVVEQCKMAEQKKAGKWEGGGRTRRMVEKVAGLGRTGKSKKIKNYEGPLILSSHWRELEIYN